MRQYKGIIYSVPTGNYYYFPNDKVQIEIETNDSYPYSWISVGKTIKKEGKWFWEHYNCPYEINPDFPIDCKKNKRKDRNIWLFSIPIIYIKQDKYEMAIIKRVRKTYYIYVFLNKNRLISEEII